MEPCTFHPKPKKLKKPIRKKFLTFAEMELSSSIIKKSSYIFSKESCSYILLKESCSYISRNGTLQL